jgi:WD40-like Beta Propeller Repeat
MVHHTALAIGLIGELMTRKMPGKLNVLITFALITLSAALMSAPLAYADAFPLVMGINGDIYTWSGPGVAPVARTTFKYNNYPPVLSPDGKTIAYKSTAQIAVNAIVAHAGNGGGEPPSTIWLMDITNHTEQDATRIAEQPSTAAYLTSGAANYIIRSNPTWSPDGGALAWTELAVEGQTTSYYLVVHSMLTNANSVLVPRLPAEGSYEGYFSEPVKWGAGGLAVDVKTINAAANLVTDTLYMYDVTGKQLSASQPIQGLANFDWLTDDKLNGVLTLSQTTTPNGPALWSLLDPVSGKSKPVTGTPELYNISAPNGFTLSPAALNSGDHWVVNSNGAPVVAFTVPHIVDVMSNLTISPDSLQIAFVDQTGVLVYSTAGQVTASASSVVSGIAWGHTAWRIRQGVG